MHGRTLYQTKQYFGSNPETIQPPNITSPRFARSAVSRVGRPITSGTSLGGPPLGIGKTSIGEKVKTSPTAHVAYDGPRSRPPNLMKSTQLAIRKGKLTNRKASNQKNDEDSRIRANVRILIAFVTLEDRRENTILRSIIYSCSGIVVDKSPLRSSSRSGLPLCYRISSAEFSPMALKSTTRGEQTAGACVNAYTRVLNAI